ncbi:MAG: hypothetical protein ABSC25_05765 [Roseiarcus sp.]
MSKKAAKSEPEPKRPNTRARVGRIEARRAKAERNVRLFNLLKSYGDRVTATVRFIQSSGNASS